MEVEVAGAVGDERGEILGSVFGGKKVPGKNCEVPDLWEEEMLVGLKLVVSGLQCLHHSAPYPLREAESFPEKRQYGFPVFRALVILTVPPDCAGFV